MCTTTIARPAPSAPRTGAVPSADAGPSARRPIDTPDLPRLVLPTVIPGNARGPALPETAVLLKRGHYLVPSAPPPSWRQMEEVGLARIVAVSRSCPESLLSHESAALLQGAWLLAHEPDVHLLQASNPRTPIQVLPAVVYGGPVVWGRTAGLPPRGDGRLWRGREVRLRRRRRRVPDDQRTTRMGIPVTTIARTLADCLVDLPGPDAFVVGDALLRTGCQYDRRRPERSRFPLEALLEDTAEILRAMAGRRGVARARKLLSLLSPASESPGESLTRYWLLRLGAPEPQLQIRVDDRGETWYLDLGWLVAMVEVEYDGEGKYALSGDALFREKQRQDRLAALGWRTLRVTKRDLKNPHDLFARVLALMPADLQVHITPRPWMA